MKLSWNFFALSVVGQVSTCSCKWLPPSPWRTPRWSCATTSPSAGVSTRIFMSRAQVLCILHVSYIFIEKTRKGAWTVNVLYVNLLVYSDNRSVLAKLVFRVWTETTLTAEMSGSERDEGRGGRSKSRGCRQTEGQGRAQGLRGSRPQSIQNAGPVRFLIFCRRLRCTASAE